MTYDETIKYLYSLEKFGIRLGLENISTLLVILDNPHNKFKSIHIAGTNGKGSTAAMTASILQSAGYKTGLYTSPHIEDFRERVMINGVMIPEGDVIELTEEIRSKMQEVKDLQPTFFEFTTAMAFLYFEREKVDFAVVEVGMGGRLDATNVLNPSLSIITEIDIEHTEHLGEDIKSITREKGGIIKDNGTVILSSSKSDVIETIESICKEKKAKLYRIRRDFGMRNAECGIRDSKFEFYNLKSTFRNFEISLLGKYQITNASTAVKAALLLKGMGFDIGEESIRRGLKNVQWSGRLEIVSDNPIIILDGAHNPAAAKILSEELKRMRSAECGMRINRLILIIGILKDKDYKGIISFLAPISDYIIITKPKTDRCRGVEDLKTEFSKYKKGVEIIEDIPEAVKKAKSLAGTDDLICITGSFFTVGEARKIVTLQN